jgi:pimeloyl-ACP methyl ester carboxylesterase
LIIIINLNDSILREADVPSIQKYFNDYKIVKIPKAGHVIHFDNPADTIKTVDNFIN